jgi:orotate phosphoribosyltransferase
MLSSTGTMGGGELKREYSKRLFEEGAFLIRNEAFELRSGEKSHFFLDHRHFITKSANLHLVTDAFAELLKRQGLADVMLCAVDGIASPVLTGALASKLNKSYVFVREKKLEHGTHEDLWGHAQGEVVLVDDMVTSGRILINAAKKLRSEGAVVRYALVAASRSNESVKNLAEAGITLLTISTFKEIIEELWPSLTKEQQTLIQQRNGTVQAKEIAQVLLGMQAVTLRTDPPYTWTSGIKAPIYCDNRLIGSFPEQRQKVIEGFQELIAQHKLEFDVIAGTATAAIPLAAFLAFALRKPMVYIRHKLKSYGASKRIEGAMDEKARVLIIEDLISTGGSAIRSIDACHEEKNADVVAVLAVFSYQMDASKNNFAQTAVPLYTLSNFSTLVEVATEKKILAPEEKARVLAWSENPEGWA